MGAALTPAERTRLAQLERVIRDGLATFHEVGRALLEIRDGRPPLYRQTHASFEDYCREKWQFGRAHAFRLIDAGEVVSNLETAGLPPPRNEGQARELAKLPASLQPAVWTEATAGGAKPTAARIAELTAKAFAGLPPEQQAEHSRRESAGAVAHVGAAAHADQLAKCRKLLHRLREALAKAKLAKETAAELAAIETVLAEAA